MSLGSGENVVQRWVPEWRVACDVGPWCNSWGDVCGGSCGVGVSTPGEVFCRILRCSGKTVGNGTTNFIRIFNRSLLDYQLWSGSQALKFIGTGQCFSLPLYYSSSGPTQYSLISDPPVGSSTGSSTGQLARQVISRRGFQGRIKMASQDPPSGRQCLCHAKKDKKDKKAKKDKKKKKDPPKGIVSPISEISFWLDINGEIGGVETNRNTVSPFFGETVLIIQ